MTRRVSQIVVVLASLSLSKAAPAGCPNIGAMDATCASDSSSIEGCTNSIWEDLQAVKFLTQGLQRDPTNPLERKARLRAEESGLVPKIRLLGSASTYRNAFLLAVCKATSQPTYSLIDQCQTQLRSAQHGLKLLLKQEVVATLPQGNRQRLRAAYAEAVSQYRNELDIIAAAWAGDPSILCNETYSSVSFCKRAVAAETDALRRQVFPVQRCGQVVPGQFVTATTAAQEAEEHPGETPFERSIRGAQTPPFADLIRSYQEKLDREQSLLVQAQTTP